MCEYEIFSSPFFKHFLGSCFVKILYANVVNYCFLRFFLLHVNILLGNNLSHVSGKKNIFFVENYAWYRYIFSVQSNLHSWFKLPLSEKFSFTFHHLKAQIFYPFSQTQENSFNQSQENTKKMIDMLGFVYVATIIAKFFHLDGIPIIGYQKHDAFVV